MIIILLMSNPYPAKLNFFFFIHLKLCLATGIHNFKWVKITHICLIWDDTFVNFYF